VAVDDLGGPRVGVAGEADDFLDRDAAVKHQADEGVPQLVRRPGALDAGGFDGGAELAADVGGLDLAAVAGGEHRPCVTPLALLEIDERLGGEGRGCAGTGRSWCRHPRGPSARPRCCLGAGEWRAGDVGTDPGTRTRAQQRGGLIEGEGLAGPAGLTVGSLGELGGVDGDVPPRLGAADGALEARCPMATAAVL
jgi:hypothetical protein